MSLSWGADQRRPGEEVSLRLSVSEPRSLVGVLVVDAATHQPNSPNDITTQSVRAEVVAVLIQTFPGITIDPGAESGRISPRL